MKVVTTGEMSRLISALNNHVGETYLIINGSKKRIIAKIDVKKPPKEFKVVEEHLYKV